MSLHLPFQVSPLGTQSPVGEEGGMGRMRGQGPCTCVDLWHLQPVCCSYFLLGASLSWRYIHFEYHAELLEICMLCVIAFLSWRILMDVMCNLITLRPM